MGIEFIMKTIKFIVKVLSVSVLSTGLFSTNALAAPIESVIIEKNYELVGAQSLQNINLKGIVFNKHVFLPINQAALAITFNFSGYSTNKPRFIELPAYITNEGSEKYKHWSIKIFRNKYQTESLSDVEEFKTEFYNAAGELKDVTTIFYTESIDEIAPKNLVLTSNMLCNMMRLGK